MDPLFCLYDIIFVTNNDTTCTCDPLWSQDLFPFILEVSLPHALLGFIEQLEVSSGHGGNQIPGKWSAQGHGGWLC